MCLGCTPLDIFQAIVSAIKTIIMIAKIIDQIYHDIEDSGAKPVEEPLDEPEKNLSK